MVLPEAGREAGAPDRAPDLVRHPARTRRVTGDHVWADPRHARRGGRRRPCRPRGRRRRDSDRRGAAAVAPQRQLELEDTGPSLPAHAGAVLRQALDPVRAGRGPRLHAREGDGHRRHRVRGVVQPLPLGRAERGERARARGRRARRAHGCVRGLRACAVPRVRARGRPVSLETRVRPARGEAEGALVLFHGRGADEHDLFPLLDALDPERRLLGVTPRAPLSLPPGGAHWYRLGGIPTPDPGTFWPSYEALGALLDELPVPVDQVVLGGFSQGAVMSWALGLGGGRPRPAALLALSGFIPTVEGGPR